MRSIRFLLPSYPASATRGGKPPAPARLRYALLLLVGFTALARAQSVRWEPAGGSLAVGQTSELSLIFENCEPEGEVALPTVDGLIFGRPNRGEQSSFNIVNGRANSQRTIYLTYPVRPSRKTPIAIPAFDVKTDKGVQSVAPVNFDVGEATVGGSSIPLESAANSRLTAGSGSVWAGEIIPINYTLSVSTRFPFQIASNPEWTPAPLVVEEWAKPEPFSNVVSGESRNNALYRSRGYIKAPGSYTLNAVQQLVNLRVPSSGFTVFQAFQAEQYTITSNKPTLVVRPLPQPAPAAFSGAVGEFTLTSKVVPATATVSEPITWTLELAGTGNWPDITGLPGREVSKDFRVVQPQAKRTAKDNAIFDATLAEDVVLIPTRPGTYTLGPVAWSYFDTKTGQYKTITTEKVTVTVNPSTPAPTGSFTTPQITTEPGVDAKLEAPRAKTPPPPAAIPRDPLPGAAVAPAPWSGRTLTFALLGSVAWLPLFWFVLALRRARRTDPLRPQREARARLVTSIAALRRAGGERVKTAALLQAWQRDTAALFALRQAAPTPEALRRHASSPTRSGRREDKPPHAESPWPALWAEAEQAIYGANGTLPADWLARAEAALAAKRVPGFAPLTLFRPRNLLPFAALFTWLLLLATATGLRADAATDAYSKGEFATAEKSWRGRLASQPTDWIAHHNLALALVQQNRLGEAAAHAVAAFAQNPAQPSVQWHLGFALDRAGYAPAGLAAFVHPAPQHALARLQSPAQWQRIAVGAGALAGLALALLLWGAYAAAGRWLKPVSWTVFGIALLIGAAAGLSLRLYGVAADPRAAVAWHPTTLRSIPTEADTAQKVSQLSAGSLAVIDKTFLGWVRLAFADGQTGWVRQEDIVPLWGTPPTGSGS